MEVIITGEAKEKPTGVGYDTQINELNKKIGVLEKKIKAIEDDYYNFSENLMVALSHQTAELLKFMDKFHDSTIEDTVDEIIKVLNQRHIL